MNQQTTPDFDLEFTEATGAPETAVELEVLPEKYQGKTAAELAKMHINAEQRLSQQGNELGQLRKLADQLLELKKENVREPKKEARPPITVDEIFADPDKAIKQTVEGSGVAQRADEAVSRVENIERQLALQAFEGKHPTYKQDLNDAAFQEWVSGNSARTELFRRADNFDVASADALWQMWGEYKELKSISDKRAQAVEKRKETLTAAKTVSESPVDSSSKSPVYSRAKLMELQTRAHSGDLKARGRWTDPEFQNELLRAYSEGRVR